MARYRFTAYQNDTQPRYIVVFGPQREIIDCQRLEPATNLRGAMTAAIARFAADGWGYRRASEKLAYPQRCR
jgi:hypothetical protein